MPLPSAPTICPIAKAANAPLPSCSSARANSPPKYQRWIDVFATLVLLFVVTVQTITLFDKVTTTYEDNVLTFDLHWPNWPFFAMAWAGDVSAVLLIAIRTFRLIFHPERVHDARIKVTE